MPFLAADANERPLVSLLHVEPNLWRLQTPFRYHDTATGEIYLVPKHDTSQPPSQEKGNATDLASVPWVVWNLISSFGRQTLPALLHDHRCWSARQMKARDPVAALAERRDADSQFYRSLVDEGVSKFRAGVMWAAVSLAAYGTHSRGRFIWLTGRLMLAIALLLSGLAAVFSGLTPRLGPYAVTGVWGWLLVLAALGVCLCGRERRLLLFTTVLLPLFGPVVLFQLAVSVVLFILGISVKVSLGGPLPTLKPYRHLIAAAGRWRGRSGKTP